MPKKLERIVLAIIRALSKIKVCKSSCCSSECMTEEPKCPQVKNEVML